MWENIKEIWNSLVDFLYRLILTIMDFFRDMLFWTVENMMMGAVSLADTLGAGLGSLDPTQYISAIPEDTRGMMAAVGFNECISIIVTALSIRILIQLIPFIRWGS